MKTGRLLDVLSGHEGPVHGLMFSPTTVSSFQKFLYVPVSTSTCMVQELLSSVVKFEAYCQLQK